LRARKVGAEEYQLQGDKGLSIILDEKSHMPLLISRRKLTQSFALPVSRISEFFEALSLGKVLASRCQDCRTLYFPPKADCDRCVRSRMKFVQLSGAAELLAYTIIRVKPSSFSSFSDYIVAVGRLEEGLNVLAWLEGVKENEVSVGMKMRLGVRRRDVDGSLVYLFVPADSGRSR
jgi:uncharacterized OB-fold protein